MLSLSNPKNILLTSLLLVLFQRYSSDYILPKIFQVERNKTKTRNNSSVRFLFTLLKVKLRLGLGLVLE